MRIGVRELALACCALESSAAMSLQLPAVDGELELESIQPDGAYGLTVLLVAGTITKLAAPAVLAAWEQLPEPRVAVAFGVCASSGGPYWDAAEVVPGLAELLPVTRFVPGCPPPADAVLDALLAVGRAHA